jgi:azurin
VRQSVIFPGLLLLGRIAFADPCQLTIESSDRIQFTERQLTAAANCGEITVTFTHSGKLPAKVMGHNWVLAKTSDVAAIANAGMSAGFAHGFQPVGDTRIIASTHIIGGGESATVRFSAAALNPGTDYTFFCSAPGHTSTMRGKFVLTGSAENLSASAGK